MTDTSRDTAFEAALAYDAAFVPRYARRFGELLLAALSMPPKANVLDLACRTGYPTVQLLEISRDGRIIAIDTDGRFLDLARGRVGAEVGRRAFFKQGVATELRFGDEFFTNVVGNLIDRVSTDRGAVLAECARVLRHDGQVVLTMPMQGSFIEVIDMFREVGLRYDLSRVQERVEQYAQTFPTTAMLAAELGARGFGSVQIDSRAFTLEYSSGADLFADPLISSAALAEWRWCAEASPDVEQVLASVRDAIDTYYQDTTFELSVVACCVSGLRV